MARANQKRRERPGARASHVGGEARPGRAQAGGCAGPRCPGGPSAQGRVSAKTGLRQGGSPSWGGWQGRESRRVGRT